VADPADAAAALQSAISGGTEVRPGAPLAQWLAALVPSQPDQGGGRRRDAAAGAVRDRCSASR
jgi:hypothetical protein